MNSLTQSPQLNRVGQNIRFASQNAKDDIKGFRHDLTEIGKENGDIVLKSPAQDDPPTRLSKGKSKLTKGGLILAALATSALGAYGGLHSFQSYRSNLPSSETVMFDRELSPDWHALASTADAARKTNGVNDPELQGKFNQQFNSLLIKSMLTLKANPGSQLDQTLVQKLDRARDFMPHKKAYPVAFDFTNFMETSLKAQGTTPAKASSGQLAQVDILNGFVNITPEFSHLSASQKMALSSSLATTYKAEQAFPNPALFQETVASALGTGLEGITLQNFKDIRTKDDAKKLMNAAVMNPNNFMDLTAGQKEALSGRLNEALNSIDHYSPSFIWALAALTLLAGSVVTAGTLTVKQGKSILEMKSGLQDVSMGLKHPTLIYNYADLTNPDAERQMKMMVNAIGFQATEMSKVFKDLYQSSAEFRKLVEKDYPNEAALPTPEYFFKRFVYETKKSLQEKQTHVDELAFTQLMLEKMQLAFEKDQVVKVALPQGMEVPSKPNYADKNADPIDVLNQERRHIEHQMRMAMGQLANLTLSHFRDTQTAKTLKAQFDKDNQTFQEQKGLMSADQLQATQDKLLNQHQEVKRAEERLAGTENTLKLSKMALGKAMLTMQEMVHKLSKAIDQSAQAKTNTALAQLNQDLQKTVQNPEVKTWLDDVELENMKAQIRQELDDKAKELDAQVQAALKSVS
jgi:hypothetical protein